MPYLTIVWALDRARLRHRRLYFLPAYPAGLERELGAQGRHGDLRGGHAPMVILAGKARSPWVAVLLIGTTLAGHQGFSTNLFTLASDLFPSRAVASVVGIGGFLGSMCTVLASELTGRVLERNPSFYLPMFIVAGSVYLAALIAVHVFTPKMQPAPMR